jgi:kinesin family protein 6/9
MATAETENTVKVIIRTRPTQHFATSNIRINLLDDTISIFIPRNQKEGLINNQKEQWSFHFDKILHNVPQEEVFEYTMNDIIKSSVQGYNGTIFAYGQTGSGKTFTISGAPSNFAYRGIIPRSISRLFNEISTKPEYDFNIQISYLEIYNEIMFDLLPEDGKFFGQRANIEFQEDNKGNVLVKGLSKHKVTNEEECFNLLFEGESNRTISEHKLNQGSSRSHCLFMIQLEMKSKIESTEKIMVSKLNFVDLAGSERVKKTGSSGITLKEATYINRSLTFLEQVVVALTEKKGRANDHVPYRQSKLTHILKDSIGGNCKTVMVANIWPEEQFLQETLSTLNFAQRMGGVVNVASVNIQLDINAQIRKMTKEIKELKQELAMHNTLANRGRINYDPYSPSEQKTQMEAAKKFLVGQSEELEFDSVRQAKELFYQIRHIYQKVKSLNKGKPQSQNLPEEMQQKIEEKEKPEEKKETQEKEKDDKKNKKEDTKNKDKKEEKKEVPEKVEEEEKKEEQKEEQKDEEEIEEQPPFIMEGVIPDKNTAFKLYKYESDYSKEAEKKMKEDIDKLKEMKNIARELLEKSKELKNKIDEIKSKLNEKKQNKLNLADEMTNVIDEEEVKFLEELKIKKEEYKNTVKQFNEYKTQIHDIKEGLDLMKIKYVDNFEKWFLQKYNVSLEEHELRLAKAKYGINIEDEKEKEKIYNPDEEAYMNAKRKIQTIKRAKRNEKNMK